MISLHNYEGKHAHALHVGKTARLGPPKSAPPTSIQPKAAKTPNTKNPLYTNPSVFPPLSFEGQKHDVPKKRQGHVWLMVRNTTLLFGDWPVRFVIRERDSLRLLVFDISRRLRIPHLTSDLFVRN